MDREMLVERFEADRARLETVAFRILGGHAEAEDAVQEAWIRLNRANADDVANLSGWLTTVVGRVCLDMLRSRKSRAEAPLAQDGDFIADGEEPEGEAVLAESVGEAMVTVVEALAPAERVAFVLHDVFGVSFDEIAEVVGRTPAAARQLASRGRRRVQTAPDQPPPPDREKHRGLVEAFFRASRLGDFGALLAVLDPAVVLRPDQTALQMGARNGWITGELRGREAVARQFKGQAQAAQVALINGEPGAVWVAGGKVRAAFAFAFSDGLVARIDLIADPAAIDAMDIEILD